MPAEPSPEAALTPSVENERSPLAHRASAPQEAPLVADGTSSTFAAFQAEEASAFRDSREEEERPTNCGEGAAREEEGPPSEAAGAPAGAAAEAVEALRQTVSAPPLGVFVQEREAISAAGTSTEVPGPPPALPAFRQVTPEGVQRRTPSV